MEPYGYIEPKELALIEAIKPWIKTLAITDGDIKPVLKDNAPPEIIKKFNEWWNLPIEPIDYDDFGQ